MNEQVKVLAGIVIAVVLATDGLIHAYWATGHLWPARDRLTLAQAVLNINRPRSFSPPALVPLVALLFLGTLVVLARVHLLGVVGQLIPYPVLQASLLIIAAGLLLRGLAGIGWALGLAASKSRLFYKLNLLVYTPVCFVLFMAAMLAAFA